MESGAGEEVRGGRRTEEEGVVGWRTRGLGSGCEGDMGSEGKGGWVEMDVRVGWDQKQRNG